VIIFWIILLCLLLGFRLPAIMVILGLIMLGSLVKFLAAGLPSMSIRGRGRN
jgi:hypothetical protein